MVRVRHFAIPFKRQNYSTIQTMAKLELFILTYKVYPFPTFSYIKSPRSRTTNLVNSSFQETKSDPLNKTQPSPHSTEATPFLIPYYATPWPPLVATSCHSLRCAHSVHFVHSAEAEVHLPQSATSDRCAGARDMEKSSHYNCSWRSPCRDEQMDFCHDRRSRSPYIGYYSQVSKNALPSAYS